MWDPYANFRKLTLANGLDVYVSQVEREFEIFGFLLHAGAREDQPGKGAAHFVEHCVSKGLSDLAYRDIKNYFEKQGGFASLGETDYLKTIYRCKCQAVPEQLAGSLDIFGRMLLNSDLSKGIGREREIITQEYNSHYLYAFAPELVLQRNASIFPGHRMADYTSPLGSLSAIQAMTQADLEEFHGKYYVPANMSIVAIGKFSPEEISNFLEKSPFGVQRTGARNAVPPPRWPDHSAITRYDFKASLLIGSGDKKVMTRGHYESWAALPGTFGPEVVLFAKNLLERALMKKIREERGWCYGLDVKYEVLQDLYAFSFDIPLKIKALPHIEELVDCCVSAALEDRSSFQDLKEIAVNDLLLTDRSYDQLCKGALYEIGLLGLLTPLAADVKLREAITADDVAEVLDCLKPEKRLTIITYP